MNHSVYIMTNKPHGILYVGMTNNLMQRVWEHNEGAEDGFTKRYNLTTLVFYEFFETPGEAIKREKSLKRYSREWKINLIQEKNSDWKDLYEELL
ncbi:MAG: hypothetical protein BGO77_01370 [Caedibacter sp. 37-49]|nr:MAG: hypothetical protein BGO77_01370 [Caedibacter sp. 37-49]